MKKVLLLSVITAMSFCLYAQNLVGNNKVKNSSCCQTGTTCMKVRTAMADSLFSQCKTATDSAKICRYLHSVTIQERTKTDPLVLKGKNK